MAAASATIPFVASIAGVGAFPSRQKARTIWVGVSTGETELVTMFEQLQRHLGARGFPPESQRFHPHVTLARVRPEVSATERRQIAEHLDRAAATPASRRISVEVTELTVMMSSLKPSGPVYTPLFRSPLQQLR